MRKNSIIAVASLLVLSLTGCGGSYSDKLFSESASNGYYYDYDYDYGYDNSVSVESAPMKDQSSGSTSNAQQDVANQNRKLIKTVSLDVETLEFNKLIADIDAKIVELGGYAEQKNVTGEGYNYSSTKNASYTARIPSDKLDEFINTIGNAANVVDKNESVSDVTLKYVDIEAHLSSVRTEFNRLNELLAEADSLETILALENRLTQVRYEIESYESSLRSIDNKVDYSTVTIYIREVKIYTPVVEDKKNVWQRIGIQFKDNFLNAKEVLADFFVNIISSIPMLIVAAFFIALGGGVLFLIVKFIIAFTRYINKLEEKRKIRYNSKLNASNGTVIPPENSSNGASDTKQQ